MEVTVKGKVVPVLKWAPRHEGVLGEWRYSSMHSLASALDEDEFPASRLGRFTRREKAPGTHWIGGWVGPRTVPDAVVKRKIPSSRRESNPKNPVRPPPSQSLYQLSGHFTPRSLYSRVSLDRRLIGL
jgi:hypothetical protein